MFTIDNTYGFSVEDLAILNEALRIRMERGEDEKSASDAINNLWSPGAIVEDLI